MIPIMMHHSKARFGEPEHNIIVHIGIVKTMAWASVTSTKKKKKKLLLQLRAINLLLNVCRPVTTLK